MNYIKQRLQVQHSKLPYILLSFFNLYLFLRQKEHERRRGRDRGRHRIQGRLQALSHLHRTHDAGLELTNHEIMT